MDRETTKITTPKDGREVIIKTYLTGAEKRAIANASIPSRVNYSNSSESMNDIDVAAMLNAAEDAIIKTVIVSIDNRADIDFVKTVLDMRSEDTDYVIGEIKKVADGLSEEKKTT